MPKRSQEAIARGITQPRLRRTVLSADWGMLPAELLRDVISAATLTGGAIRFGYTRDGGAYALGMYGLGEPFTEYVGPGEDVEGFLREVIQAYRDQRPAQLVAVDAGQAREASTKA